MNVLALDTASGEICACLLSDDDCLFAPASASGGAGKTRSTLIIPLLRNLLSRANLEWPQLQALAFSHGPGSFTGLRIAAATLAGLNSAMRLPVISCSSLAITARQAGRQQATWVLEDARAGEAFVGCYQHGRPLRQDACISWEEVQRRLPPAAYICQAEPPVDLDRWQRLPAKLSRSAALAVEVRAACEGIRDLQSLPRYPAPVYLQLSQAERQAHA